jgi:hypothetical protein
MASGHTSADHWLADLVADAVMAAAATGASPVTPAADGWSVGGIPITIRSSIWSWSDWLPLAQAAVAGRSPTGGDATTARQVVRSLQEPTVAVMLSVDARIGARLASDPLDPDALEAAALLDAVLAFREAAGPFCDARRELSSACGRLAVARALRPEPGPAGLVAAAVVETLAGRGVAARSVMQDWDKDPLLAPWGRALERRITGDWRIAPAATAARIECLAQVRALAYHKSAFSAADFAERRSRLAGPDVGRIIMENTPPVELGHAFGQPGLDAEVEEAVQVWSAITRRRLADGGLPQAIAMINGEVEAATPRAIPPKRWGDSLARHLLHRLVATHRFMINGWGVPEEAANLRALCAGDLAGIRVMPLARIQFSQDPERDAQAVAAARLITADPGLLTPAISRLFKEDAGTWSGARLLPQPLAWWRTIAPTGTTWAVVALDNLLWDVESDRLGALRALVLLNPDDPSLRMQTLHVENPRSMSAAEAHLGDIAERSHWAAAHLSGLAKDETEEIRALTRMAALNPFHLQKLGDREAQRGATLAAVAAYERFHSECRDRVSVSNGMRWLVMWYADNGQTERAQEIAAECYEVFSHVGIETKALLDEKLGNWDAAEAAFKDAQERYNNRFALPAFWIRTADQRPASARQAAKILARTFPDGMGATVAASSFAGPPARGLRIHSLEERARAAGLVDGMVIVALDSRAVTTDEQYLLVRALSPGAPLRLIVWDGAVYREIVGHSPNRRLGFEYEMISR